LNKSKQWLGAEAGIILLSTIIMIATLSMLVLSLMKTLFLYSKTSARLTEKHEAFYRLEVAAGLILQTSNSFIENRCHSDNLDANQLIQQVQLKGCAKVYLNQTYLYLLSDQGEFPCLKLKTMNKYLASHHWLITVFSPKAGVLQLRVANQGKIERCKFAKRQIIHEGVISWRYLDKIKGL
jgi:hypothetical protein